MHRPHTQHTHRHTLAQQNRVAGSNHSPPPGITRAGQVDGLRKQKKKSESNLCAQVPCAVEGFTHKDSCGECREVTIGRWRDGRLERVRRPSSRQSNWSPFEPSQHTPTPSQRKTSRREGGGRRDSSSSPCSYTLRHPHGRRAADLPSPPLAAALLPQRARAPFPPWIVFFFTFSEGSLRPGILGVALAQVMAE